MAHGIAGTAGMDTDLDETDGRGGLSGLLKTALIRGWPYLFLLLLSLVGICWANVWHQHSTRYWVSMGPLFALVCVALAWRRSSEHHSRLRVVLLQAAQWVAVMVAMYLVAVSDLRDLLNDDARGLMMLTLLALGVFISGLNLIVWQLCVLGMFLAISVPLIAWVEAASVLIFLLAACIIVVALIRLWMQLRSRPQAV
jgi:MFS family permease